MLAAQQLPQLPQQLPYGGLLLQLFSWQLPAVGAPPLHASWPAFSPDSAWAASLGQQAARAWMVCHRLQPWAPFWGNLQGAQARLMEHLGRAHLRLPRALHHPQPPQSVRTVRSHSSSDHSRTAVGRKGRCSLSEGLCSCRTVVHHRRKQGLCSPQDSHMWQQPEPRRLCLVLGVHLLLQEAQVLHQLPQQLHAQVPRIVADSADGGRAAGKAGGKGQRK